MKKILMMLVIAACTINAWAEKATVAASAYKYNEDTVNMNYYNVYFFDNAKSYSEIVDQFKDMCLWDIQKELANNKANLNTIYWYEDQKAVTATASYYTTGQAIADVIKNQSTAYALFTYWNNDWSEEGMASAYMIVGCDRTETDWSHFDFNKDGAALISKNDGWHEISSIPEPTSGMLLLLGVAGLALKRKRA